MLPDSADKKPVPGNDLTGQVQNENHLSEKPDENAEHDLDDLVHNTSPEKLPEDEEIDPDDAVHTISTPSTAEESSYQDPDDLVHGN